MYCPECGNDAGDAKFCPECGADLSRVKDALRGKTTGGQGGASRQAGAAAPGRAEQDGGRGRRGEAGGPRPLARRSSGAPSAPSPSSS